MDWIHCNNCFLLPDSEKSFFLTSCGHIYCCDCEEQCARGHCKLCGNQCSTITLSSTMKPDVQLYFTDPDELLKKKMKEVQQVSEFQKNHRARLMAHQRKQLKKFQSAKEDFKKLIQKLKELDSDRKKLAQENDVMKKFIGMQRSGNNSYPCSAQKSERSYKSPYDSKSTHSNLNTVLTKLADKIDNSNTQNGLPQRMCVISPPKNGKLGVIPNTPSPSSYLKTLNYYSRSNKGSQEKITPQLMTPNSTPGSICEKFSMMITPQNYGVSPMGSYNSPSDHHLKNASYKRDVRKIVVHPYTPND